MNTAHTATISEMQDFTKAASNCQFSATEMAEVYKFILQILRAHKYEKAGRKNKGIIREYLQRITGYSRSQTTRLIKQYCSKKVIEVAELVRPKFGTKYTREDVVVLAETDEAHSVLSGPATVAIMKREFTIFKRPEYERLSKISVSHLYNLRHRFTYLEKLQHFTKTIPNKVTLGQRIKPRPEGKPGFIRVDSVHQGDFNGEKGVYHINLVDEVTQWEIAISVEKITEQYLVPALAIAMASYPFKILNFHADNGSEYINRFVARLLEGMKVKLTKSRPRHSGDNGLVECKNGAIIRKQLGYAHIPQKHAKQINEWMMKYLNPYINFHRPSGFPVEIIDVRGKVKKVYPKEQYKTPYEKLKSLQTAEQYLKPGINFAALDLIAYTMSDTESAKV